MEISVTPWEKEASTPKGTLALMCVPEQCAFRELGGMMTLSQRLQSRAACLSESLVRGQSCSGPTLVHPIEADVNKIMTAT